jgi:hypothetical protein
VATAVRRVPPLRRIKSSPLFANFDPVDHHPFVDTYRETAAGVDTNPDLIFE